MARFEDNCIEYGQVTKQTLGHMFSKLAGKIIAQFDSNVSHSKEGLHFDFVLWDGSLELELESLELKLVKPRSYPTWAYQLWVRVHLVEVVKQMRAELNSALGRDTVVLTSNVEPDIEQVYTIRQSATRIRSHNHRTGQKGVVVGDFYRKTNTNTLYDSTETQLDEDPK